MTRGEEPLAAVFQRLIANYGPITLQHFMGESNARYYAGKDPLGSAGDFITAPEVSQMFGELIGLWLADIWIRAGRGGTFHYVELGPGRGTLARDALRAMQRCGLEPQVHLVEASTALREIQRATVPHAGWHHDVSTLPDDAPLLLVANEFLDALPVRQLVKTPQGWRERMVDFQDGRFLPVAGDKPMDAAVPQPMRDQSDGTLIETCPGAAAIVHDIAGRLAVQGGAALFIDYGYSRSQTGSTLQALKEHTKIDPFAMPGEADLTCLVDFEAMADAARAGGAHHLGTVTQGHFLRALGIETRAANLAASAPQHTASIGSAKDRLIGDSQMGTLFKVMGLASPDWPQGAGF
ncbi:class I SAM-dependent methyltransferase [Novosphingobium album (ex Hu et al. 2023)]|uniref:SAM-dependent methyltransferase n=1 Tax=Novosphingobium album (ex Hu et al. 2023) TaxID=2930093 RepID=A0ABT0B6I4_9SPHN|nr:SAM-dependent methyltransferase [Novosphingobium album (ex Hu et al. 2023)]MCJ2180649.1 SAM-dependent methyltransferase [Novosphingobium album (ex Hu et al. 2023)]